MGVCSGHTGINCPCGMGQFLPFTEPGPGPMPSGQDENSVVFDQWAPTGTDQSMRGRHSPDELSPYGISWVIIISIFSLTISVFTLGMVLEIAEKIN